RLSIVCRSSSRSAAEAGGLAVDCGAGAAWAAVATTTRRIAAARRAAFPKNLRVASDAVDIGPIPLTCDLVAEKTKPEARSQQADHQHGGHLRQGQRLGEG